MKILLDSGVHFEDHKDTCGRVEERRGCRRATKVAAGQPNHNQGPGPCRPSPWRNHAGGPFLPAKLAPFLAATDTKYAMYVFDYGAPTGLRVAMQRPERVTAIVSQNGNAYEEGLGEAWQPIQRYWREPTVEHRNAIRAGLTLEGLRHEYSVGIPDPTLIKPEGYTLDAAMLARPGNVDIQLDLFLDYASNVKLYRKFQEYFRIGAASPAGCLGQI